jgi:glycosyltransferase involved in cell wall biosynthesis
MQQSDNGAADVFYRVIPRTLADAFLKAPEDPNDELAPLSPYMIHVWRQWGLPSEAALSQDRDREEFVYAFYDQFHQRLAPHRLVSPPNTLRWLNRPALDVPTREPHANSLPGQTYYLTRYMLHVWKQVRRGLDIFKPEGYLRFLTWFALECIPRWNLPPSLVPDDLLPVLNRPVRPPLPMTDAMRFLGELRGVAGIADVHAASDESIVAISFEVLPDLLQAHDPRLVPDLVSAFWSKRLTSGSDSLTAYEYFVARVCRPLLVSSDNLAGSNFDAVWQWCSSQYCAAIPEAELFFSAPAASLDKDSRSLDSPGKAVFIYRDHHTIAGLSRAGLVAKEAFSRTGLEVIDLDFSFGRTRMLEEYTHNQRLRRRARSTLHVLNLNPEYLPECLMCCLSTLDSSGYVIGQFYWELSDIVPIHECGLSLVNEIWVASEYLRDVYRRRVSVPVYVMGQAVETGPKDGWSNRASFNLPETAYIFLFSFDAASVIERKNPLGAIQAFRKAFPTGTENAILVLKTRNLGTLQTDCDRKHWRCVVDAAVTDRRIRIIDHTMTSAELHALMGTCDCYISLHRSEGFGYGPADAMGLAKPVITTAYSGVTDFCTAETAFLVNYDLQPVPIGAYPYTDKSRQYYWASPDIGHAASHMRRLYEDPTLGERTGQRGHALILERYSVDALRRRYVARLTELGWL